MPQIQGLLEAALYVDDPQRSAEFFRSLLGLEVIDADDRLIAMGVPGPGVLLLCKRGASATRNPGAHDATGQMHVAFKIAPSELEVWEARLRERGVTIVEERHWPRGGHSLYFRDPDGHLVELATPGLWSTY